MTDGAAPASEHSIRRDELPHFIELARRVYEDEIDALRERRDEFKTEGSTEWCNAALRACGVAASYIVVMRDFMEAAVEEPPRRRRRKRK